MLLSWFDVILVAVMLFSGLLAMLRGLTREVLSITSWALAAVAMFYFWPKYIGQVEQYIEPAFLANVVLAAGIFIVVLVLVSLVTFQLSDRLLDSQIGALDRTLGFVFGLVRGLVLVVILHLFYSWLVPQGNQPKWIREARALPLIERTGDMILSVLPENPEALLPGLNKKQTPAPEKRTPDKPAVNDKKSERLEEDGSLVTGSIKVPPYKKNNGYGASERQGLDQLFEGTRGARD